MSLVRQSLYRHYYGEPVKDTFHYTHYEFKPSPGESNNIAVNAKYFAAPSKRNGTVIVVPHKNYGQSKKIGGVEGHAGDIGDIVFHPFNDDLIATGSNDATIKIWNLDEEAITAGVFNTEYVQNLQEHEKKVTRLLFHPTANNVLASSSADKKIKVWDIEAGTCGGTVSLPEAIQDFSFNLNGQLMAATSRDKIIRILDPRLGENAVTVTTNGHTGSKPAKCVWMKKLDRILTAGFSKTATRELMLWDPRNMTEAVFKFDIDQASGILMPFYDEDTSTLLVGGKGDGNIRSYEVSESEIFTIDSFNTTSPQSGLGALPKLACDIDHHEIVRIYKLNPTSVTPISFKVPRKSEAFQSDIFPDSFKNEPTNTAAEYFNGVNTEPTYCSLKPNERPEVGGVKMTFNPTVAPKANAKPSTSTVSVDSLQAEVSELKKKVEELTKENELLKRVNEELRNSAKSE